MLSNILVSLHLPKTAGSSFRTSLEDHYKDEMIRDYGDFPINTSPWKRNTGALVDSVCNRMIGANGVLCIHGHFLPLKYRLLREAVFITWMRNPVDRLASHYYYWKRTYNPLKANRLHRRVIEEEWSLYRFCMSKELRNFYSQFLWCFPLSRFDFIGITEFYESEAERFSVKVLKSRLSIYRKNVNQEKIAVEYFPVAKVRSEIESYHAKDMELYRRALMMRDHCLSDES